MYVSTMRRLWNNYARSLPPTSLLAKRWNLRSGAGGDNGNGQRSVWHRSSKTWYNANSGGFTMTRKIRIATYNIHKGRGMDGRTRIERTAHVLETTGAYIVALQEVVSH